MGNPMTIHPNATTEFTVLGADGNGCKQQNYFKIIVGECLGISDDQAVNDGFMIYPNPFADNFFMKAQGRFNKTIEVFDIAGRPVLSAQSGDDTVIIDAQSLQNGLYFVKIQSKDIQQIIRVIKN
jgi:hypothetical protein